MNELPPEIRSIMESYFLDCESTFKIQRHHRIKRRDVETAIETGLDMMRNTLKGMGVNGMSDID